jgi:GTPase
LKIGCAPGSAPLELGLYLMFIDEVSVSLFSGPGGDGCVSFRREKFVPRGGPDGGDGGDGGSVIVLADRGLSTLLDLRYRPEVHAGRGEHGKGKDLTGARGEDIVLRVPPGTTLRAESGELLADLTESGQQIVLLAGGRGGRGNARFATARQQAPRYAQPGGEAEGLVVNMELKLLADIGLVGFPNAGKSTLLSRLSAAHPKIANYPFTTLEPHLGIVRWASEETFVMADLPGLIEGAHAGKGLGMRFLRHIERTRALLFMLDCTSETLVEDLATLRHELEEFDPKLLKKPHAIAFTKCDLLAPGDEFEDPFADLDGRRFKISAVSGEGVDDLTIALGQALRQLREADTSPGLDDADEGSEP